MRRLLRDVAEDQALGDTTTLADPTVVDGIKSRVPARPPTNVRREPMQREPGRTPGALDLARRSRSSPGRRSSSTSTACSRTPRRRQHYLEAPRRDWRAFFDACGDDPVIEEVKVLLDLLDPDLRIVLLTARPDRVHHLTEAWLRRYEIRWDVLIMRPWGDYELCPRLQAVDASGTSATTASSCGSAFEDDRRNVEMFRAEGIPCLYVHSGYYD